MRRLSICADDYAMDPAIDAACLALLAAGRLSAVSCMTASPRWPEAARALRALPAAEVGLHVDFTHAWPQRPPLAPLGALLLRACLGALDRRVLQAWVGAQLDAFEAAMGRAPDFVDGHQHVHQFPVIRDVLLAELGRRYGKAARRPWVRSTWSRRPVAGAKGWLLQWLGGDAFRRRLRAAGFDHNQDFAGIYAFDLEADAYLARLGEWLQAGRDDLVLMCHPALSAPPGDGIAAARVTEFGVLSGEAFGALLARLHCVPRPRAGAD